MTANQAAVLTGLCRETVYVKCRKFGIGRKRFGARNGELHIEPEELFLLKMNSFQKMKSDAAALTTSKLKQFELHIEDLLCERMRSNHETE
jgi:hypothetical protein